MHRDELGKTQSELMATKELYVNVCEVKDELEDKVRDLQAESTQAKVEISYTFRITELLALYYICEYYCLSCLFHTYVRLIPSVYL